MKRFLFIVGIVAIAGGIFAGGFLMGTKLDFMNAIVSSSNLNQDISRASTTLVVLRDLEAGKLDEAKAFLNLQLDASIIGMDSSLPYCPTGQSTHAAKNLLAAIAEHRSQHPVKSDKEIDHQIREILEKSVKQNQASVAIGAKTAPQPQR